MDNLDYNDYIHDLAANFIEHIVYKKNIYFDSDDYIDVIDYFLNEEMYGYALDAITESLSKYPKNELLIDLNAEYWKRKNDYKKALEILSTITSPQTEMTFGLYGECYINLGKHDIAIKYFNKYLTMVNDRETRLSAYNDIVELLKQNRYLNSALYYTNQGLINFPEEKTLLLTKAEILFTLEHYQESKELYNQLLDNYPYEINLWLDLAEINRTEGSISEALRCYEYISAIDPEYEHIEELKAICFIQLSEYEEAINILLPLYKNDKNNQDAIFLLANSYFLNDEKGKAMPLLSKILENKHETPIDDAYLMYANCVVELNDDYNEAINILNLGLKIYPSNEKLFYQLGTTEMNYARKLSDNAPEQSDKHLSNSINYLKKSLEIIPNEPQYNFTIAHCYLILHKFEEALHYMTIALENGFEADRIYIFMAISAWKINNLDLFDKYYFESKSKYSNYKLLFEQLIPEAKEYISKLENL